MRRAALAPFVGLEAWVAATTGYLLGLLGIAAVRGLEDAAPPEGEPLKVVVIVPAHDEQHGLPATLGYLAEQDYPAERLEVIVIADNCTDATATAGRDAGVEVWERTDDDRGKGQVLAWAIERVWEQRPDTEAIAIVDADCRPLPDLISALERPLRGGAPAAQAIYDVLNAEASPTAALRWAAFALKHRVRPRGRVALGLSAGLFGTGMAFRADLLKALPWDAFSVAEDIQYHLHLAEFGARVAYVHDSMIRSAMPTTGDKGHRQQLRWESGNARLAREYAPRLIASGLRRRDANLTLAGVELVLLPQSLLGPLNVVCLLAAGVLRSRRLALMAVATTAGQAFYVLAGLRLVDAPPNVFRALLSAPRLVADKLGIFARIARGRGTNQWLRTDREPVTEPPVAVEVS
ncbi:glycosyltransferase [Solirubrobacter sp. CPCC 204708]|uniref:Glycosyltransferase family 2 protein n=1 Tax=Solirubrobacter deserti TaxID=2282478 RepID=A0ABT4RMD5_9ACTN|nr:glycosyltransferase family 2 protein [Solirubrobacter deserti]MBE2317961.1 glycosyltransferase [Solirubrobacter deserti]MDA0139640.1 glycosyltransferase family 2 protein [Solirubrobacter deserti]